MAAPKRQLTLYEKIALFMTALSMLGACYAFENGISKGRQNAQTEQAVTNTSVQIRLGYIEANQRKEDSLREVQGNRINNTDVNVAVIKGMVQTLLDKK